MLYNTLQQHNGVYWSIGWQYDRSNQAIVLSPVVAQLASFHCSHLCINDLLSNMSNSAVLSMKVVKSTRAHSRATILSC